MSEQSADLTSLDKGPWQVFESDHTGRVIGVASDDFEHDVLLKLTGDFADNDARREYCQALADKLNSK